MEARIPPHYLPPKKTLMPWNRISSAPPPQPMSPGLPARLSRFSLPHKLSSPATRSPCPNENDASLPGTPLPYRTSRSPSATPVRPSRLIPWAMPAATAHNTARTQGRKVRRDETGHARRPITTATTLPQLLTWNLLLPSCPVRTVRFLPRVRSARHRGPAVGVWVPLSHSPLPPASPTTVPLRTVHVASRSLPGGSFPDSDAGLPVWGRGMGRVRDDMDCCHQEGRVETRRMSWVVSPVR